MGFCANNAGNPDNILETQKSGYVSKHESVLEYSGASTIHMNSLLFVMCKSNFSVILR